MILGELPVIYDRNNFWKPDIRPVFAPINSILMKNKIALFSMLLLTASVYAQKNVVKGHAIGLPANPLLFSLGIGYERLVADFWSAQVFVNRRGWDMRATDGTAEFTNAIMLEARHFFGRNRKESLNKVAFVGPFLEGAWAKTLPGGETDGPVFDEVLGKWSSISPGFVVGGNAPLGKKLFLEYYIGSKYRFVKEEDYSYLNNMTKITEVSKYGKVGLRLGFNFCYRL